MTLAPPNRVRAQRLRQGLTQQDFARSVGLSRQSIAAIELGRSSPAVDVALRIATVLGMSVEALFGAEAEAAHVVAETTAPVGARVAVASIGARWVAHALGPRGATATADGVVRARDGGRGTLEMTHACADVAHNILVSGCAGALGVLAERLNAQRAQGRCVWLPSSSMTALEMLAARRTHVAGVHLTDRTTGVANVGAVEQLSRGAGGRGYALVTLARWEAGLVVRDERDALRHATELTRRGLTVALRERGSGARELFDRTLDAVGAAAPGHFRVLATGGHAEVAGAVALGAADVGVATRDAAIALGLRFIPLAEERYDLVFPASSLEEPSTRRLLDMLTSIHFRRELASLGYDVSPTGDQVAVVGSV